jgi:protein phosphatase
VEDREILAIAGQNEPQKACDFLVALTLDRGAVDNVTVVMVQFNPIAPPVVSVDTSGEDIWE